MRVKNKEKQKRKREREGESDGEPKDKLISLDEFTQSSSVTWLLDSLP